MALAIRSRELSRPPAKFRRMYFLALCGGDVNVDGEMLSYLRRECAKGIRVSVRGRYCEQPVEEDVTSMTEKVGGVPMWLLATSW